MQITRIAQQPPSLASDFMPRRNALSTLRCSAEKVTAQLQRFMEGLDFPSDEKANDFLKAAMIYKNGFLLSERPAHLEVKAGVTLEQASAKMRLAWTDGLASLYPEVPERWAKTLESVTPLDRAQNLMSEAWEALGTRRRDLASEALEICADCADAYVLLAQESTDLQEAKSLYEKGMEVGKRQIDELCSPPIKYWSTLGTRPYLRARAGLAATLWQLGQHRDAIDHFLEVLCLDPIDNQGNRYQLIHYLLYKNELVEAADLLAEDEDNNATWLFSKALLLFLKQGASGQADVSLRVALKQNLFVPQFLLGEKPLPEVMPATVRDGDEDEAVEYVAWSFKTWSETVGALDWLRKIRDAFKTRTSHPSHKVWMNSMESAGRAAQADQDKKAKGHLLYALRQCEKFGEDELLFETWLETAAVSVRLGPIAEDEEIFQRPVRLGEELYGSESFQVGMALLHLGVFFVECKKWTEAESALLRAEAIAEETGYRDLQAAVYIGLARTYNFQGKTELSRKYNDRAKPFFRDEMDDDHFGSPLAMR